MARRKLLMIMLTATLSVAITSGVAEAGSDKKDSGNSSAAAATVGDYVVTLEEVDERAASRLSKVRMEEYNVRRSSLDAILSEHLLDLEAKSREMEPAELLEKEVVSKVDDPTAKEIETYYARNKRQFGAKSLEQATPSITSRLRSQKLAVLKSSFVQQLRDKYEVRVTLDPPRTRVALDDDASRGPEDAPITIVEFSDYQCPYCKRAEETVEQVIARYPDKIRVIYRDYPLHFHQNAKTASMAAECAEEQGKFWEMHKAIFTDQSKLSSEQLTQTAGSIGLEVEPFKECLESNRYAAEVDNDFNDGQSYGVTGTPTFFINGIMIVGAQGVDAFSEIIDRELERAP